jgi:hypothetical protein
MLTGGLNMLGTPCEDVNRTVPYFKEVDLKTEGSVNKVVFDALSNLSG